MQEGRDSTKTKKTVEQISIPLKKVFDLHHNRESNISNGKKETAHPYLKRVPETYKAYLYGS